MTLRGEKPQPKGYPANPQTIGEHLKKKSMDLNLRQREMALQIGVHVTTYPSWEQNRARPRARYSPALDRFLQNASFSPSEPTALTETTSMEFR